MVVMRPAGALKILFAVVRVHRREQAFIDQLLNIAIHRRQIRASDPFVDLRGAPCALFVEERKDLVSIFRFPQPVIAQIAFDVAFMHTIKLCK